ncbi:uncharacterized protein LOC115445166 [Manduca sexta]|uniref:uncharacterized protein LOC115445166 n=1 Tax=Manduca sexta TaxID=7130 RepID=UPI0011825944|nr:uncharacterized protein LOC115445166 [Manduca sexta]
MEVSAYLREFNISNFRRCAMCLIMGLPRWLSVCCRVRTRRIFQEMCISAAMSRYSHDSTLPEEPQNVLYNEYPIPSSKNIPVPTIWYSQWTPYTQQSRSDVDIYPYVHPLYSKLPVSMMNSLPPVHLTHFSSVLPRQEANFRSHTDMSEEERILLPNDRVTRSSEEDFIEQLEHDAIMNNILPTMPFPFFRESQRSYPAPISHHSGSNPFMALFRSGITTDYNSIPLLLGCTPTITEGTMEINIFPQQYHYNVHEKLTESLNKETQTDMTSTLSIKSPQMELSRDV